MNIENTKNDHSHSAVGWVWICFRIIKALIAQITHIHNLQCSVIRLYMQRLQKSNVVDARVFANYVRDKNHKEQQICFKTGIKARIHKNVNKKCE